MKIKPGHTLLTAALLLLAPFALHAQQPGAPDLSQIPAEAQALLMEMQQVQQQIQPIQLQALADPELQAEQAALGAQIQTAMAEVNPAVPQQMERLQALAQQAQAARGEEDQSRLGAILTEARGIEMELQAAQNQVMQRPDLAPRLESFQTKVQAKMVEVDPEVEGLFERLGELERQLMTFIAPAS